MPWQKSEHGLGQCEAAEASPVPDFQHVGSQGCCVPSTDDSRSGQPEGTFYNIADPAQCSLVCKAYSGCTAFSYRATQSCRLHWSVSDDVDGAAGCDCFHKGTN